MVESLKRVDGLRGGLKDVDEPLVRADLEVLARVLVLERAADHAVAVLLGRQRNGTGYRSAGALRGLHDLAGRLLDGRVVIGLEPNPDLVLSESCHNACCLWTCRGRACDAEARPLNPAGLGRLLDDFGHHPGADGAAALANGEAQALVHGDRLDQLDVHLHVVARHDHLRALGQVGDAGHVSRAEVELRAVAVEERRVAAALLLLQAVDLRLELGVRGDRPRLAEHLAALDVLALDAAEQAADVVAGLALIEDLAEHLDAGDDRAVGLRLDADDLDGVAGVDDALLDAAGGDGAAAGDREDVLDRHQERLVEVALRLRDVVVELLGELDDLALVLLVALERLERRAGDERDVVAREVVLGEEVADLHLDELEQLLVVDHVGLVEEHDDVRHADLAGEQDVLTSLRHGAVGRGDHEDRAVHLGGARDHVLHVVRVARAVDVGVVAVVGLVLDVRRRDRDAARLLLRRVVDLLEGAGLTAVLLGEHLGDRSGQRRLAVVDVTDGPDIDMRLVPLELLLRHFCKSSLSLAGNLVVRRTRADYRVHAGTGSPVRASTTFSAMFGGTSSYLSNCIV